MGILVIYKESFNCICQIDRRVLLSVDKWAICLASKIYQLKIIKNNIETQIIFVFV